MSAIRKKVILTRIMCIIILCTAIFASKLGAQNENTGISEKVDSRNMQRPERSPLGRIESTRVEVIQEDVMDSGVTVADIKELARRSTDIIVGRPLGNRSSYDARTDEERTKRLVHVQVVFKGKAGKGDQIELELPVGSYIRQGGEIVSRRMPEVRGVSDGVSYIIFMRESEADGTEELPVYRLALGMQGMFELEPETNTILPMNMARNHPFVKKYENMSVLDFMNEVMTAVLPELSRQR